MKPVYIDGIGIISRCACSSEQLVKIARGEEPVLNKGRIEFTSDVPPSKLRRCSRYNKLAAAAAAQAIKDGKVSEDTDKYRIGTIISTGYGASENNIQFSDSVVKGNPQLCSPTIFSGTVPNSCVGQICIVNGFKGVSTLLMGGDPMEYASLLLDSDKADVILCGAEEEYSEELFKAIQNKVCGNGIDISEGTVLMTLRSEKTENAYCRVSGFSSASLPVYPYVHRADDSCSDIIGEAITELCGNKAPDVVFTTANGTYFDAVEKKAVDRVLGADAICASPKKIFGEALGSGYMLSTAFAAACLREKNIPYAVCGNSISDISSILVTGLDTAGNYCCMLLEEA